MPGAEVSRRMLAKRNGSSSGRLHDEHRDGGDEGKDDQSGHDETTSGRKSTSTRLVQIAEELYEFGVSDSGETFGVPRSGPKVLRLLRGGKTSLRAQLTREYFRRHGRAAPAHAEHLIGPLHAGRR